MDFLSIFYVWQVQVLLIVAVLDILSTFIALRKPGNYEANPVIAFFMRGGPLAWPLIKMTVTVAAAWYAVKTGNEQYLLIFAGLLMLVVLNNIRLADR